MGLGEPQRKKDVVSVIEAIRQNIFERKVPIISRGSLAKLTKDVLDVSIRRADAEFWALFKDLTREPNFRIPFDKELGVMKIGHSEFFYPLEMIRNYILTKRLASFPAVIFYLLEKDSLADDWIHTYILEKREYVIQEEGIYRGELEGLKIQQSEKEFIPLKLANHTLMVEELPKIQIESFEINGRNAGEYPKVTMVEETLFKRIYHLQLTNPLQVGDKFLLKFHCSWLAPRPSLFSYVFMPHVHLRMGVMKELTRVISDKPLKNITVYRFDLSSGNLEGMPESTKELRKRPPTELSFQIENQELGEVYIISFES